MPETLEGRVIRSTGSFYTVQLTDGQIMECRLKGKFRLRDLKNTNPIVVGDRVSVIADRVHETGVIEEIYPRTNYIIRKSTRASRGVHILAANLDQALLVATLHHPRTSPGFIDRFLVTAEAYHIPTLLVFNKTDLYDRDDVNLLQRLANYYQKVGYGVIETSAVTGQGIEALKAKLHKRTTLIAGHSGVGKSALIKAIEPGLDIRIGDISDYNLKGRHTTTFAQMHYLSLNGYIVDTPGIKEFGLIDFKKEEVGLYFPEIHALLSQCQYYNCTHDHEPGCAVKKAVAQGQIADWRYRNYLHIIHDEELETPEWE
ncbi:MAG: ribosome biosis GTPase / thiamine phosphate phosphatase [Bacteroidales bacterium]|jgi:ribosome biogenesis GTPase|nr:ribosome biosis GTPase / thiamine phosphate phosphatase [Bacteroidales bacterium]MDN5329008.1 ribosome biosis GTPase / thiamine phosphate phosphatase [Bacteroidales bacterium]